jgi:hypothetical protein
VDSVHDLTNDRQTKAEKPAAESQYFRLPFSVLDNLMNRDSLCSYYEFIERLPAQRRNEETGMGRHWQVQRRQNADFYIVVFGSIVGFAVLIALMVYGSSISQH